MEYLLVKLGDAERSILKKFGMDSAKEIGTPMGTRCYLATQIKMKLENPLICLSIEE